MTRVKKKLKSKYFLVNLIRQAPMNQRKWVILFSMDQVKLLKSAHEFLIQEQWNKNVNGRIRNKKC